MDRERAVWRVIDNDYIHYEYKVEDTGTGPFLQARHDHDAAMLRALLLFLLSVGLLGLGTLQQADGLGVVERPSSWPELRRSAVELVHRGGMKDLFTLFVILAGLASTVHAS